MCYLTLCERSYPKKLAYQYLEELQREFEKVNRSQIETVARPYAFIKFGKSDLLPLMSAAMMYSSRMSIEVAGIELPSSLLEVRGVYC